MRCTTLSSLTVNHQIGGGKMANDKMTSAEYLEMNKTVKQNKYKNVPVIVDDIKFPSKREARYYGKLKILKASGHLINFRMQVKYDFIINGIKIGSYRADFVEEWPTIGIKVVDAKGVKTPVYELKKKLMFACFGIIIKEV